MATWAEIGSYTFYLDVYGGVLDASAFSEAMPAALRCVRQITGNVDVDTLSESDARAWGRAVCAASEAFSEFGEGRVGGYAIGSFKITNYMEKGTTGLEVATSAALAELAGTGLAFTGVA